MSRFLHAGTTSLPVMVLGRALAYAALFVGVVLVFVPSRILSLSGVSRPSAFRVAQGIAMLVTALGAALALWCVLAFAFVGRGTPAPFDAPRRLVASGPYRLLRNPMYAGAVLALAGAALFYRSVALMAYAGVFFLIAHGFVLWCEEPSLRVKFGEEYDRYCRQVRRWWPGR